MAPAWSYHTINCGLLMKLQIRGDVLIVSNALTSASGEITLSAIRIMALRTYIRPYAILGCDTNKLKFRWNNNRTTLCFARSELHQQQQQQQQRQRQEQQQEQHQISCIIHTKLPSSLSSSCSSSSSFLSNTLEDHFTDYESIPTSTKTSVEPTVKIKCLSGSMLITIKDPPTNHETGLFSGMIYPRGLSKNSTCLTEYRDHDSPLRYKLPLRSCNTMPQETTKAMLPMLLGKSEIVIVKSIEDTMPLMAHDECPTSWGTLLIPMIEQTISEKCGVFCLKS
uniref:ZP domain-containing protein n=1 Tax=Glossina pallidipes TaxID=7398 RepID=A0A1B0AH04_GLOPL